MPTDVIPNDAAPHGIRHDYLDPSVDPGVDFYQYATGGWQRLNKIPPSEPRWGPFMELRDRTLERVRGLIEEICGGNHTPGTIEQQVGDFYLAAMNEGQIEADGVAPLTPLYGAGSFTWSVSTRCSASAPPPTSTTALRPSQRSHSLPWGWVTSITT
jgi:hypothetical protein